MTRACFLKSRMKLKFHVRFGTGGGVGDRPTDHNLLAVGDALFVYRVRIEDHGFLANLYFAVLEVAGALVDVQDGTCRVQLRVDKSETAGDRAFSEQVL